MDDADLLVALAGIPDFPIDFPARYNAIAEVEAVIPTTAKKNIGDVANLLWVDILQENDVRLPVFDVRRGISFFEKRAVQRDHADDRTPLMLCGKAGTWSGCTQVSKHPRLVCADEQRDRPDRGHDQGKRGPEEIKRRARQQQAAAAPEPDRDDGECGETVRLPGETVNGEDV